MNSIKKFLSVLLAGAMCLTLFVPAMADDTAAATETEKPLVIATSNFSGKFSPFFCDTVYDRWIGETLTQELAMTSDRQGAPVKNAIEGETIPYNGTDYTYTGITDVSEVYDEASDTTTYTIKIKDGVKFADGEVMDADDLIFSYYVYADPSYDGSASLYSYGIIGMENYRQNNSMAESVEVDTANLSDAVKARIAAELVAPLLTSEMEWAKSIYGNDDYKSYTDAYPVAKDLFAFLYSKDEAYDSTKVEDEAQVLADIIAQYGSDYAAAASAYGDDAMFDAQVETMVLEETLATAGGEEVSRIEGIKKVDQNTVTVTTKGFQAPAIYNICGIAIAPMHYYGDVSLYDYENDQFGFTRGDLSAVKAKTSAPMGAGPYKFVKYENKIVYLEANENYWRGEPKTKYVQYRETLEPDKVSAVGTGTVDLTDPTFSDTAVKEIMGYNSNGELDGDKIVVNTVDNLGYGYLGINADTVNVGGEPLSEASKNLRKALATVLAVYRDVSIDSYYGDRASIINYPISNTSWAAPQKTDEDYKVAFSVGVDGADLYTADMTAEQKYDAALAAAVEYLKAAGYTYDEAAGKFTAAPEGAKLEYEIIIPADGAGDHPSFGVVTDTRNALEKIGITLTINDPADSTILWDRLDAGTQELWAAAWQATVDPDLYQTYHSSNIVGLPGSTESNHYHLADPELDKLIMDARSSADQAYRKATYKACLDRIVDAAVEIPVYQRQNCIIFSPERINMDTVTPDITTFWDWTQGAYHMEMVK